MFRHTLRPLFIFLTVLSLLGAGVLPLPPQWLEAKPLPDVRRSTPPSNGTPYFAVYKTRSVDANDAYQLLAQLYAGRPNTRISLDSKSQVIGALASPAIHAEIAKIIGMFEANARMFGMLKAKSQANLPSIRAKARQAPKGFFFPEAPRARLPNN